MVLDLDLFEPCQEPYLLQAGFSDIRSVYVQNHIVNFDIFRLL